MRGESDRVAARVRGLLADYAGGRDGDGGVGLTPASEPAGEGPEGWPVVDPADLTGTGPTVQVSVGRPSDSRPAIPWSQRLLARIPVRVDPGRRGALGVGLAVLIAAVVTGLWLATQRPRALSATAVATAAPGSGGAVLGAAASAGSAPLAVAPPSGWPPSGLPATSVASARPSSFVVVHVAGKVRRPGLYRLAEGARVDDAVRAAGGPLSRVDLSSLNLAARLIDGEQVRVGLREVVAAAGPSVAPSAPAGPLNLNAATAEQLQNLPGIGPVLAGNILEWRDAHGGFASVDQLTEVTGIGPAKLGALRERVTV